MVLIILLLAWYLNHVPAIQLLPYVPQTQWNVSGPDTPSLSNEAFSRLQQQALSIPSHRTGVLHWRSSGLIDAQTLEARAGYCTDFYNSPSLLAWVRRVSGIPDLQPLSLQHPLACCVLRYDTPGDHITWHKDINYYQGRTVTVLFTLLNRNANDECCSANQSCVMQDGKEICQDTIENSFIVLDGSRVLHSARSLAAGEHRAVLSMVFCTDQRQSRWQALQSTVKDWSFTR